MKNPPFDSLVWGSLRLDPIISLGGERCSPSHLPGLMPSVLIVLFTQDNCHNTNYVNYP